MENKLSYVAAHKAEYQEIYDLLKSKSEYMPGLETALSKAEEVLGKIKWFEDWGIDIPWYMRFGGGDIDVSRVEIIHNQPKPQRVIYPNEDMLVISHHTGPFIFSYGDEYPKEFFDKFMDEVRAAIAPDYEDRPNHELYYKKHRAKEAYESYNRIRAKYNKLNEERFKEWRISELERQLKAAKGE